MSRFVYIGWAISAAVLFYSAYALAGKDLRKKYKFWGFLIENRKGGARYSLTKFQVTLWTILILSLLSGVFFARLFGGVENPHIIAIPDQLLVLMGISLGSATLSTAIKNNKDNSKDTHIHAGYPNFGDLFRVEEGSVSDETWKNIALEKFQNFWVTVLVMVAYIGTAIAWIESAKSLAELSQLPLLEGTWNTLLGISHAAYVGLKMPNKPTDEKKEKTSSSAAATQTPPPSGDSSAGATFSLNHANQLNLENLDLKAGFNQLVERVIEDKIADEGNLVRKFGFNVRELTDFEIHEARQIFGDRLDYGRIRIFEGANLPNFLDDIGRFIKKMPPREENIKNAITLGNYCFFGRTLKTDEITDLDSELDANQLNEMSWLMHELTHAWQYQTKGWKYLWEALDAQIKLGTKVYEFGGEDNLRKEKERGRTLRDFNLEQQGSIVQKYYEKLKRKDDTSAFAPFIQQI